MPPSAAGGSFVVLSIFFHWAPSSAPVSSASGAWPLLLARSFVTVLLFCSLAGAMRPVEIHSVYLWISTGMMVLLDGASPRNKGARMWVVC